MRNLMITLMTVVGLVFALAPAVQAASLGMEFVTIGNPNNADDPDTGVGGVGYKYSIGKYEVTAEEWNAASGVGNANDPGSTGRHPAAYVSWHEAAQFCNWMTTGDANSGYYTIDNGEATAKDGSHYDYYQNNGPAYFIPTKDEWYKAAFHKNDGVTDNYWDYPTGSDDPPKAEDASSGSNSANYNDAVGHRIDVGSYPNSDSPYGTYDQAGNVAEWVHGSGPRNRTENGYQKGVDKQKSDHYIALPTNAGAEGDDRGFRVVEIGGVIPEPTSLALLGIGGLLVMAHRRRR